MSRHDRTRTWVILLSAVFVLSGGSIFARLAGEPPVWTACLRCCFAVGILAVWRIARGPGSGQKLTRRDWALATLGGLFLALHLATWIASLGMTSVAISLLFVSSSPVWALVLGVALGLERGTPVRWLACGIAFSGAALLALSQRGGGATALPGVALAALSGAAMGAYMLCGRARHRDDRVGEYALVLYGVAALSLLIASFVLHQQDLSPTPAALGWVLLMAVCSQVVGHTTVNWAIPRIGASPVGIALLLEPVFASAMALAIFRERPTPFTYLAAVLIAVGVALVLREK